MVKMPNRKEFGPIMFGAASLIFSIVFSMNHFFMPRTEAEAANIEINKRADRIVTYIDKNNSMNEAHYQQAMSKIDAIYQYIINKK